MQNLHVSPAITGFIVTLHVWELFLALGQCSWISLNSLGLWLVQMESTSHGTHTARASRPRPPLCSSSAWIHMLSWWSCEVFHIRTEDNQTFHCLIKYREQGSIDAFCAIWLSSYWFPPHACLPLLPMVALGICRGKDMTKVSAIVIQSLQAARKVLKVPWKNYYL